MRAIIGEAIAQARRRRALKRVLLRAGVRITDHMRYSENALRKAVRDKIIMRAGG